MINSRKFFILFLIFLTSHLTLYANEPPSKIKTLSKKADIIITGKVIHKQSAWNQDKTRIYTTTTIKVNESLKGTVRENSVDVTYPGGEVGGIGELYTHMPVFDNNEEVLVFLKKDKKNKGYKVLDGEDGKIKIVNDAKSGDSVSSSNSAINKIKLQIKQSINEQR